jgi:hypothetical protein
MEKLSPDERYKTIDEALKGPYLLTGSHLRDMAEGLAQLAGLGALLCNITEPKERYRIALLVKEEALPFYRAKLPKSIQEVIELRVKSGELEQTCLNIIAKDGFDLPDANPKKK